MRDETALAYLEQSSNQPFDATIQTLLTAILAAHMRLFARIDHGAVAAAAGLRMPPTVVLLFGNPIGGTPAMLAAPRAALELPLRILVREDDNGRVTTSCEAIGARLIAVGVPPVLARQLEAVQQRVLAAVAI
jgi:uncharacterized protein (DUF302 family)